MADSYTAVPPPVWYPDMAKRRNPVALTARNVDEFIDWVASAPMSDVDAVRSAVAAGSNDDAVAILGRELNRLPVVDKSRHNVILSILGESRREAAIVPLERFIWNVVDVLAPSEFGAVTESLFSEKIVCDLGIDFGRLFRSRAVEMLTHIGSSRALEGAMRAAREHPEADVRRAAIDAYLYNHGDADDAVRYVRTLVRDEDQAWVAIPRRTLDTDPDELRERVEASTDRPPTPTQVRRPTPPAPTAARDHVSEKPPEF